MRVTSLAASPDCSYSFAHTEPRPTTNRMGASDARRHLHRLLDRAAREPHHRAPRQARRSAGVRDLRSRPGAGSRRPHHRTQQAPHARAAGRSDGYNPRGTRILTRHLIRTAPTPAFAPAATREILYCRVIRTSAKRPPRRQCQVNNISAQSTFIQIMRLINFPRFHG